MASTPDIYELFGKNEEAQIEKAIEQAELNTSGEIRLHVENKCKEQVLDRAAYIFDELEMQQTELRNGVLIYVAFHDRKLAVIGDAGINAAVPNGFWDQLKSNLVARFSRKEYIDGLEEAILKAGDQLKSFFPYQSDDVNELPNQISFGKD